MLFSARFCRWNRKCFASYCLSFADNGSSKSHKGTRQILTFFQWLPLLRVLLQPLLWCVWSVSDRHRALTAKIQQFMGSHPCSVDKAAWGVCSVLAKYIFRAGMGRNQTSDRSSHEAMPLANSTGQDWAWKSFSIQFSSVRKPACKCLLNSNLVHSAFSAA